MSRAPTPAWSRTVPTRPAVYARISDDRFDDQLGVKRQVTECQALARRLGWPEPVVYQDNDISAFKRRRRPDWERLCAAIAAGKVDGLLAMHPERFTRSDLRDLEDLIELLDAHDVAVETVHAGRWDVKTGSGRTLARVLGSVARGESERMSERVKSKMAELRGTGTHLGREPFGYRKITKIVDGKVAKTLDVVPEEAAIVREVAQRILDGWPLRRICADLNERGVPTKLGASVGWAPSVVRGLVKGPTPAGFIAYQGEIVGRGNWEPILDEATWERAGVILSDPDRMTTVTGRRYLLAGLIYTAVGQRMAVHPRRGYFAPGTSVDVARTEAEVVARLWARLAHLRALPRASGDTDADLASAEIGRAEEDLKALAERRRRGEIELVEYEVLAEPMRDVIRGARKARKAAASRRRPDLRTYAATPAELRHRWENGDMTLDEKREVLAGFVDRVTIHPRRPGRPIGVFDPDRIEVRWSDGASGS